MLETYRRNIVHKNEEIARLQSNKATEQNKLASLSGKIISVSQALARDKNPSGINSKQREIFRYQQDKSSIEKRIADIDSQIARKTKELIGEQRKASIEETREHKKYEQDLHNRARESASKIYSMNETIRKHEMMHRDTLSRLEEINYLPERIVVLFLAANPIDQPQLRLDEEARAITEMIRKSKHRDSVKFESRWAIQPDDVLQALNELNPTIVHFSGHGSDSDKIVFQRPDGTAKFVTQEAIVQTMVTFSDSIRLIFFNTCYSINQAESLVRYVEAAIGMNTTIGDNAARVFASQFYSSIGFGLSLKKSFEQAKAALMLQGIEEENTPQIFVRADLNSDEIFIVSSENKFDVNY